MAEKMGNEAENIEKDILGTTRMILDSIPEALFVVSPEGKYIEVNYAACQLLGYERTELLELAMRDVTPSHLYEENVMKFTELKQKGKMFEEIVFRRKDGIELNAEIYGTVLKDGNYLGTVRDITERLQMQEELKEKNKQLQNQLLVNNKSLNKLESTVEALRESKEKYKELFQNANDIIYTTDLEGNFLSINQVGLKTYGYNAEEMIRYNLTDIVHPSFVDLCLDYFGQKLTGSKHITGPYEVLTVTKDGRNIWVEVRTRLIKKNEVPVGLQGIVRDITERKQMIEAIKKTEQEKDLILSSISEIVSFQDMDMRIRWANVMASKTHNIPIDEIIGRHCYEVWQHSNSPCLGCPVKETLERGEKASGEITTPDGIIWQIKSFPVKDEDNKVIGVVKITKDITERKRMESEMARFDRMNLIGEMAASFGHEIRNPMAVIKGFLQLLYEKKDLDSYRSHFEIMIEEVDRANSIITEYLSLAKNKAVNLRSQSLNSIIEALYPLIFADALHGDKLIELELKDIPFIIIDKNDIHQLILNLVRNGLEAMTKGGALTIRTYLDDKEVVLAIKDQGIGIERSIQPKLGIPFITTKENGIGIGLPICYSIADRNKAQIGFETSSKGTTFYVRFPSMSAVIE